MNQNSIAVNIAMMKIARPPQTLHSLGLGSCIGVAIYDPGIKIGGLLHALLPRIGEFGSGGHSRAKFADSGIEDLVELLVAKGARRNRLRAKIAGGAAMFALKSGSSIGDIGKRNVQSSIETLQRLGIELVAQDTGGNKGRTIIFNVDTGELTIKMIDRAVKVI
jgi:chemotaxis protein CheD